jgi:hypothetical protein
MRGSFFKGAVVGFVCAVLGGATVALAGSGINGVFNLGVSNSVDAKTTLTGATAAAQLKVVNTSAAAGASGLVATSAGSSQTGSFTNSGGGPAGAFVVNAGVAPFTVNSTTKVGALNADQLDGLDSAALQKRVTGTCVVGTAVRVVNSNGSVSCQAVAGSTRTAAVSEDGVLEGGSATSASRGGTGNYTVTFPSSVSDCVAVAAPGAWHGGQFIIDAVGTTIVPSAGSSVSVYFNTNGGVGIDTDFMLILAC